MSSISIFIRQLPYIALKPRGAPIIDELDLNQCPLCELQFIMTNPVSPHCTALAMRGTCSPWSAHPHVQRSAVRYERNEVREGRTLALNFRGGHFPYLDENEKFWLQLRAYGRIF